MMKKMIALFLVATLCVLSLAVVAWAEPATETSAQGDESLPEDSGEDAEMAEGADSDWYMAVLADEALSGQFPYHCFADVNGDGVPVLIVSTTDSAFIGDEDQARVYVYDAGEAKLVMEAGGAAGEKFFANADDRTLTHYERLSGEEHIEVYAVADGALTLVTRADHYAPNHGPNGANAGDAYFQDDAEIPQEDGEALFARYAGDDEALSYEGMGLSNPWTEMSQDELWQVSGLRLGVPEGAENVVCRWLESEGLAEVQFTLDGDEYCARVQPGDELMNISGMYFAWENEEEIAVGPCSGTIGQAQTGSEEWVELCQWYDAAPGLMYSLSVYTIEPDGLDLTAVAEMVYVPMQGEV